MPPRKKPLRRKKAASVGLTAVETKASHGAALDRLTAQVEADGGAVLATGSVYLVGDLLADARGEDDSRAQEAARAWRKRGKG